MRTLLATALLAASLGAVPTASAQEAGLDWAKQDRARGLVGLRAVGLERERLAALDAGGELALGGWLAGWLAMELRVGLVRTLHDDQGDQAVRDLWYGMSVRARLVPGWVVSPTVGIAAMWHELSSGDDGLAARGELGIGAWAGDDVVVVFGFTGSAPVYRDAGGIHAGAFLGLDLLL